MGRKLWRGRRRCQQERDEEYHKQFLRLSECLNDIEELRFCRSEREEYDERFLRQLQDDCEYPEETGPIDDPLHKVSFASWI